MKITILGSGTSTGVPQLLCDCPVCVSTDPRDRRLRSSALVTTDAGRNILIDCGPDFRTQMLRTATPEAIDAVLISHSHYDHVAGLDDLRPYCLAWRHGDGLPLYCGDDVARNLRERIPYCFRNEHNPRVPRFDLHPVEPGATFTAAGVEVTPLRVIHGHLPILGYRIGPMAYITDASAVPDDTIRRLRGVDTLVVNALRNTPHPTHMNLREALDVIASVAPRRAILTHMSHGIGLHDATSRLLPEGVTLAYDGQTLHI